MSLNQKLQVASRDFVRLQLTVLALCLVCSVATFHSVEEKNIYVGDSRGYERMSQNLFDHMVISLESHDAGRPYYSTMARMPGFPALLSMARLVFGASVWNYTIVNLFAYTITTMMVTGLAFQVFGFYPALISGLLLATHVSALFHSMTILPEPTTNLIILALLLVYWRYRDSSRRVPMIVIGFLTGLAALYREPVGPVLSIGLIVFGVNWRNGILFNLKKSGIVFVFASLSYSPWVFRNYYLSNDFVPVTVYFKGAGINLKDRQTNGDASFFLSPGFWEQNFMTEYYVLDMISKDIGYNYYVLPGNLEDQKVEVKRSNLVFDPAKFYPVELVTELKKNNLMQPTIKIELVYTEICRRFTESIRRPISMARRLKVVILKSLMLYTLNDTSPYSQWRYGLLFHRVNQFRWYCFELPLFVIGLVATLVQKKVLPLTLFIFLYTCLVVLNMSVESRYGLLPIALFKTYIGYGSYLLACRISGYIRRISISV